MNYEEAKFAATFAAKCAAQGVPAIKTATEAISEIDAKLNELDTERAKTRKQRALYVSYLKSVGQENFHNLRFQPDDVDIPIEDESMAMKDLRMNILQTVEKARRPISIRQIMDSLNTSTEQQSDLIRQIDVMTKIRVLARDQQSLIVTGQNWENRHQVSL